MEQVALNKLCQINIGRTPSRSNSRYWGKGHKWLSISDMKTKYICETKEEITDMAIEETKMKIVPKNTVVMSFKLSIGKIGITQEDIYTNEAIASFPIIQPEKIMPEYLYYALKTLKLDALTDRAVMGATLNKAKLNELSIPLPTIAIQKRIVEILNKAQSLIDKRKAQITALSDLTQSVFFEMFGNPIKNTNGWEMVRFDEVVVLQRGHDLPISARDLTGEIDVYGSNGVLSKHNAAKVIGGGIITGRSGSIGNVYYTYEDFWPLNTTLFSKETYGNDLVYLRYLVKNFKLERFVNGTGVPTLNRNLVHSEKIINVPRELQTKFADIVLYIEKQKVIVEASLKELEKIFNSLMQKAFKGELFNN